MSADEGWNWPPPPPPPPPPVRRYARQFILVGAVIGMCATIGLPLLGLLMGGYIIEGGDALTGLLLQLGLFGPLVLGIILVAVPGSPTRRGIGIGLIIGWALTPIVFAGLCIMFTGSPPKIGGAILVPRVFGP